ETIPFHPPNLRIGVGRNRIVSQRGEIPFHPTSTSRGWNRIRHSDALTRGSSLLRGGSTVGRIGSPPVQVSGTSSEVSTSPGSAAVLQHRRSTRVPGHS